MFAWTVLLQLNKWRRKGEPAIPGSPRQWPLKQCC